jgi:hypothetical protein
MSHRRAKKIRQTVVPSRAETGVSRGQFIRDNTKYTLIQPTAGKRKVLMLQALCPKQFIKEIKEHASRGC